MPFIAENLPVAALVYFQGNATRKVSAKKSSRREIVEVEMLLPLRAVEKKAE